MNIPEEKLRQHGLTKNDIPGSPFFNAYVGKNIDELLWMYKRATLIHNGNKSATFVEAVRCLMLATKIFGDWTKMAKSENDPSVSGRLEYWGKLLEKKIEAIRIVNPNIPDEEILEEMGLDIGEDLID